MYTLPAGSIPDPAPACVELLQSVLIHGEDISTPRVGYTPSTLPYVRATHLYDAGDDRWARQAVFQVDLWAETEAEASNLAEFLDAVWPDIRRLDLSTGGYVSGCWVVSRPRALASVDESDPPRYFLQLGLILHGDS